MEKFLTESDRLGISLDREKQFFGDFLSLSHASVQGASLSLETLEELLARDASRETDGLSKKIRVGRIPTSNGKLILVPTTVEEKLVHGDFEPGEEGGMGGTGEGEEGEVIGEQDIHAEQEGCGEGEPGGEDGGDHGLEDSMYDLGEKLSEKFELPNLEEKRKTVPVNEYTYDLTDRHRKAGQVLDKKATLRSIVGTNIGLGRLNKDRIDTTKLLVAPRDMVYRVLSRERTFKSQAMIFFIRDYSGSMTGKPTLAVVNQHVMIYSWLLYVYEKLATSRFILHDTEAKEVQTFSEYFRSKVAGGTRIVSSYKLVNDIVEREGLERDYNIYVFQGTDGDDWDRRGEETLPELHKMLTYVNRMGVLVVRTQWSSGKESDFEKYIKNSEVFQNPLFRQTSISEDMAENEAALVDTIKHFMS